MSSPVEESLTWGSTQWPFMGFFFTVLTKTQKSCDVILTGHKQMAAKSMPDQNQKMPYLVLGRLWHGLQWLTEQHPQLLNVILTFYYGETGTSPGRTLWSSVNLSSLPEHQSNMRTVSLITLCSNWHIWRYNAICQYMPITSPYVRSLSLTKKMIELKLHSSRGLKPLSLSSCGCQTTVILSFNSIVISLCLDCQKLNMGLISHPSL